MPPLAYLRRGVIPAFSLVCVSSVCVSIVYLCVGPQRGLSCVEGDLASVEF